ncbi:MAG: FAD-dependent monooxygenase, partial [Rudaea sp.]|nr:FAD-dependent monooxygenase [Rudaea sp.]
MPVDTSVLIAGAGPTGLTLACELARRQVPFRLIDGAPAPFNGSRGKGLQPRSLEVFDDLGIASQAVAGGRFHMPMRIYAADGYRDVDVHEGREPRPDVPYASSLIIPQWRVEDLLRQKLGELGGRVEYAVSLRELSNDGDGVSVVLEHADGR